MKDEHHHLFRLAHRSPPTAHRPPPKLCPGYDDSALFDIISNSQKLRAIVFELYGTG